MKKFNLMAVLLLISLTTSQVNAQTDHSIGIGEELKEFEPREIINSKHKEFKDFAGKLILIEFFGST